MILTIDNLEIPETLSGVVEKFNADSRRRTVNMRLITKASRAQKWRVTLNYESRVIPKDFQFALYAKIMEMRTAKKPIVFISPYDGSTVTANMKCVEVLTPRLIHSIDKVPVFYTNCGAVFEEV